MQKPHVHLVTLALVICLLFTLPISAVSVSATIVSDLLSYEDAVRQLADISPTDEDALGLLYQSFDVLGARRFAPQYKYLTSALLELSSSENADFESIDAVLALLGQNGAFMQALMESAGLDSFSLDTLRGYVYARKLEVEGNLELAYRAYMDNQILDSLDRAMAIFLLEGYNADDLPPDGEDAENDGGMEAADDEDEEIPDVESLPADGLPMEDQEDGGAQQAGTGTAGQTVVTVQTQEPEPTPAAIPWPSYILPRYSLNPIYPDDKITRVQARTGPSKNYSEAGAYKTLKMSRTDGLFVEGTYVLVDMNYPTVGVRRVYFPKGTFHNTYTVPETTLAGYPAVTTQAVSPRYGPGFIYDPFPEAAVAAGTSVTVFFEENGYVFAEYEAGFQLLRAWINAADVTPE